MSTSSSKTLPINNFKNHDELYSIPIEKLDVFKLSTDQHGCRFLQKKLEYDPSISKTLFKKIFNSLIELIVDPFGNYLIQKLIDYLNEYEIDLLVEKIHSYLYLIAVNQYGTRSLQKIIEKVTNNYQIDLIIVGLQTSSQNSNILCASNNSKNKTSLPENNSITSTNVDEKENNKKYNKSNNNIVNLIKDLNGNHVIQKCIFMFSPEKFQFIIDAICIENNIVLVSTHKHGCCVLQKLLNNSNFNQVIEISKKILSFLSELINDQFGNYIIQFFLELNFNNYQGYNKDIELLIDIFFKKIYANLIQLSCLKFSSNVIEKFIKILKNNLKFNYLSEIIQVINSNFGIIIKDKFGNYVIQTILDQLNDIFEISIEFNILVKNIKSYLPVIRTTPYGKKIQMKIDQIETNYSTSAHPFKQFNQHDYSNKSYSHNNFDNKYNNFNNINNINNINNNGFIFSAASSMNSAVTTPSDFNHFDYNYYYQNNQFNLMNSKNVNNCDNNLDYNHYKGYDYL